MISEVIAEMEARNMDARIVARNTGEQAGRGVNLATADVIIAATALELGFAVGIGNLRDFSRIPDLHVIHL